MPLSVHQLARSVKPWPRGSLNQRTSCCSSLTKSPPECAALLGSPRFLILIQHFDRPEQRDPPILNWMLTHVRYERCSSVLSQHFDPGRPLRVGGFFAGWHRAASSP